MNAPAKALETIEVVGGHPALDFVNTVHSWTEEPPADYLGTFDEFVDWNFMTGLLWPQAVARFKAASPGARRRAFESVRALRADLYRVFRALAVGGKLPQQALDRLNDTIRRTATWRRLAADRETGCTTLCCTWDFRDAPAFAAVGPVAWAAADLLEHGRLERLKACPGEHCGWLFLDASKNRSRTWCSMKTCGNTAKVKRFRQRSR